MRDVSWEIRVTKNVANSCLSNNMRQLPLSWSISNIAINSSILKFKGFVEHCCAANRRREDQRQRLPLRQSLRLQVHFVLDKLFLILQIARDVLSIPAPGEWGAKNFRPYGGAEPKGSKNFRFESKKGQKSTQILMNFVTKHKKKLTKFWKNLEKLSAKVP